jgi:hypothetical protein
LAQRADLTALFGHIKRTLPEPRQVIGASWLYNLQAYRCLFPESYLATGHVLHRRFRHMPLWGQFVDRYGEVRENLACEFRDRRSRQSSLHDLDSCFPFQVLSLEAPAVEFYDFYGV